MNRQWGTGAEIGAIYLLEKKDMESYSLGNNSKQPKVGDLCLCVRHSGDCFYSYIVLKSIPSLKRTRNYTLDYYTTGLRFGAYVLGKKVKKLKDKEFHLLLGGIPIEIKFNKKQLEKTK